jgi:hypothetical protein
MREGYTKPDVAVPVLGEHGKKDWDKHWMFEEPIILDDALERLNAKLKAVDRSPA